LDTEWLLSTLFDASLLSTSKPPETAALFLPVMVSSPGWKPYWVFAATAAGLPPASAQWFVHHISRPDEAGGV